MASRQFTYDLFISYAHRDDHDGWVASFVQSICEEHARFTPTPLEIFFDRQEILTMHDWEHRILRGLRGSKVMLAVLSPHYFDSEYCRKEWEIYLEHELDRAMMGLGIAPIYIVSSPHFESESHAALDSWTSNLRRRQYLDVREWRPHGPSMLQHEDVQLRLQALEQQLTEQCQLAENTSNAPTTIPRHNLNFVGRMDEIRGLRETLALSRVGSVAVVQGLSGMGKSALAFEYAHAYAREYPGGRFLVAAKGMDDFRVPLVNLADQIGVVLSADERKDLDLAFARVRAALEQGSRSLLVLDDVDNPTLLSAKGRDTWMPRGDAVHVMATTTLAFEPQPGLEIIRLDALSERDAVSLLERHRPFEGDGECEAARAIAARLGYHPFGIEIVGVYLWQNPDVDYQGYLARLDAEGLEALESVGQEENIALSRHHQSVFTELMEPTLARLTPRELVTLEYGALLPQDHIALPWLKALAAQTFPDLGAPSKPGYPDPWRQIERRLLGLRLLTSGEDARMARVHRLTQDVVMARQEEEEVLAQRKAALVTHALERGAFIQANWIDRANRWEIQPLLQFALSLLAEGDAENGPVLANRISDALLSVGRFEEGANLLRRAIEVESTHPDDLVLAESCSNLAVVEQEYDHLKEARALLERALAVWENTPNCGPDLAMGLSNLALVEQADNHLQAARKLLLRAMVIEEADLGPDHPNLATSLSNLATVERELGHLDAARDLLLRAVAIDEKVNDGQNANLAIRFANLATVEQSMGHLTGAREWLQRAITVFEAILEADHPHLAISYSNLANIERELGRPEEARVWLRRAIDINEKVFPPEHPELAVTYSNMALVEQDLGKLDEAKWLLQRAISGIENTYHQNPPNLASALSNLALVERDMGNLTIAQELLNRAIMIDEATYGPENPATAISYSKLATVERLLGHLDEAWELLYLAVSVQESALGPEHPRLALSRFRLSQVEFDRKNHGEARRLALAAFESQKAQLGEPHPDTQNSAKWLMQNGWQ